MEKMNESGINFSSMSSISKSGLGLVEVILQVLSENEVRMSFRDFKMDGEVRFRVEPLKKG
ncbi:hypothetical protein [Thermococcus sp.]|uniref:hypothetical protein n=1 Tax=Thermococcus sp. TaxID=35749 RepID=UPI0026056B45|nr:hypothetical protein [Thermococcus sp.]